MNWAKVVELAKGAENPPPRRVEPEVEADVEGWNGPVPGFLGQSAIA